MMLRKPRAGKGRLLLIIAVAIGVVAGGAMFAGPKLLHKSAAGKPDKSDKGHAAADQDGKKGEATVKSEEHGEANAVHAAPIVELGEFLVNLQGGAEAHYLRAEVSVRLEGLPVAEKKSAHGAATKNELPGDDLAVAKDCLTTVMSGGVYTELRAPAGRAKFKELCLSRLQKALPAYTIHDVLFTSFVMQ
jgi:flagellar basal body-associated protein FliL